MRPARCISTGQALRPIDIVEVRAAEHVFAGQPVGAEDAPRLAHTHLRRDLGDLGGLETRHLGAQETHEFDDLAPAFGLGGAELARVGGVDGAALRVAQLRDVGAPFRWVALRAQDGAAAREVVAAGGLRPSARRWP